MGGWDWWSSYYSLSINGSVDRTGKINDAFSVQNQNILVIVIIVGRSGRFNIWTSLRLVFSEEFDLIFRSVVGCSVRSHPGDCWRWTGRRDSADPGPVATLTTGDNGKASDSLEIIFYHQLHTIPTTS